MIDNDFNPIDLMKRLDHDADILNMHLACGEYVDGEEREMAHKIAESDLVVTPGVYRVLAWLVWDEVSDLGMVDLPLDECDIATYEAIEKAAKVLSDEIIRQGDPCGAVRSLLTHAISERAELARWREQYEATH